MARGGGLLLHDPGQGGQAALDIIPAPERRAGADQRFRQAGVVVGEHGFEPRPVGPAAFGDQAHQRLAVRFDDAARDRMAGMGGEHRRGAENREAPRARADEIEGAGDRAIEQGGRPIAMLANAGVARRHPDRPERAALAVLGALVLAPGAIEVHEIPKRAGLFVPGIVDERRIDRGPLVSDVFVEIVDPAHQDERARVVVHAIAVIAIGHRIDAVLQHAGRVAHADHRAQIGRERFRRGGALGQSRGRGRLHPVEQGHRALGAARPDHRAAALVGARRDRRAMRVVVEQAEHFARQADAVAKLDQHAVIVRQDFGRVDIGRRDHRLAERHRVGQRARGDLRRIEIGRDVDVGRLEIVEQLLELDEAVDEADVIVDAQFDRARLKAVAIGFALMADEIGVRRAEHDIQRFRVRRDDRGHRLDHEFDALARREQPEGEQHLAALEAEARLHSVGLDIAAIGHAVGN